MEGLLPAAGSAVQLILEHLWGALLVISESLRHIPALPAFLWEILVCTVVVVMVALIVKRRVTFRSVKALGERCSAHDEVCAKGSENTGTMTQADDTLRPPGLEASHLTLQILCLSAINTNPSRSSLQAAVHLREEVQKCQPSKPSRVTGEKPILKASEKDGGQLQKKTTNDLNENTHFPASVEWLEKEISRWKQRVQEKEEKKERQGESNARMKQILRGQLSQLKSVAESLLWTILSPDPLGDGVRGGNSDVEQKREAEPGHRSIHPSEVDVKGVTDGADFSVSPQSPEEKRLETARRLWEEEEMNEELVERITRLQTEKASFLQENAKLESEIEQLKLQLQILPEFHEDHLRQLQEKLLEEERRRLDIEKKLPGVYRHMNSACETRNIYRQMAEDMGREVERTTSYTRKEILFHARRAQEAWMAAVLTQRKLERLRRENDRTRQMLAKVASTSQPFPRGPFAPAAPPAAPRGPEMWGDPRGHWGPQ